MSEPSDGSDLPTFSDNASGPGGSKPPGQPSPPLPHFPGMETLEETAPGTGGMGRIYRARDAALDRIVAVKTVQEHLLTAEGRTFFVREARAVARLNHPNIVKIYGFNPDHLPPYYVMEFLEGRPLDEACGGRPVAFVVEVLEKVARALAYAHSKGVVHRDIKPANILVDFQNEPHLADFGLAQKWDEAALEGGSTDSLAAGTPLFLAPELYQAGAAAAPTADIFALGVTLYRLLTGRYPFAGKTRDEVRQNVCRGEPALPQEIDPQVPEPLQRICLKAIEQDPEARYQSAGTLADDLRRFREGREIFVRPTRYEAELRGKLQNHVTEIRLWLERHLINVREMDRLVQPYRKFLAPEFPWHDLARRFPWETTVLRLGGWLLVLGTVLWVLPSHDYWPQMNSYERLLAVGIPVLLLNLVGWFFHHRKSRLTAFVFLSVGALLIPLFMGALLTEYHLLRCPQTANREFFGKEGAYSEADIAGQSARIAEENATARANGEPPDYIVLPPTNMQSMVSISAFVAYLLALLTLTRVRAFVIWTGLGFYLLFTTVLLLCGLNEWWLQEHRAQAILYYLGLALAFLLLSLALEWRRRSEWAMSSYLLFPVPFVVFMTALAWFGADEWLEARGTDYKECLGVWLMANGLVYFGSAIRSERARPAYIRFWGEIFMLLVPVSLLVPLAVLWRVYNLGKEIVSIGGEPFKAYALLSFLVSVILVGLGTRLRRYPFVISGLAGLAAFIYFATEQHFTKYLYWPLALAVSGGIAMAVAVIFLIVKAKRRPDGTM